MNALYQNHEFYNNPIRLTEQQSNNPMEVLKDFFSSYNLQSIRRDLWNLVEVALTSNNALLDKSEMREHILFFCNDLETFIEASHIINQNKNGIQQKKHRTKKRPVKLRIA